VILAKQNKTFSSATFPKLKLKTRNGTSKEDAWNIELFYRSYTEILQNVKSKIFGSKANRRRDYTNCTSSNFLTSSTPAQYLKYFFYYIGLKDQWKYIFFIEDI
jgi:hypothetical protein